MELYAKYLSIFTSFYVSPALDYPNSFKFTLEGISLKKLHEGNRGGGVVDQSDPSPPL